MSYGLPFSTFEDDGLGIINFDTIKDMLPEIGGGALGIIGVGYGLSYLPGPKWLKALIGIAGGVFIGQLVASKVHDKLGMGFGVGASAISLAWLVSGFLPSSVISLPQIEIDVPIPLPTALPPSSEVAGLLGHIGVTEVDEQRPFAAVDVEEEEEFAGMLG